MAGPLLCFLRKLRLEMTMVLLAILMEIAYNVSIYNYVPKYALSAME